MTPKHQHAQQFLDLMAVTQAAYENRQLDRYLAAFAEHYSSVQLGGEWFEDKAALRRKVASDIERFEIERMDFEVKQHWYAGETGFARLGYRSRLRFRDSGRVLIDERENVIVGEHLGGGRWRLIGKIVVRVENYLEEGGSPGI